MDGSNEHRRCARCGSRSHSLTFVTRCDMRKGWLCERCQPESDTLAQLAELTTAVRRLYALMERKHRGTGLCRLCHCATGRCRDCHTCERCHRPTACATLKAAAQLVVVGGRRK